MPAFLRSPLLQTALISLLLALAFLGSRPIWDPDEGRYSNIALNMVESGDWVQPMRNDYTAHWTKPPLTYWAIAASTATFGRSAWAARLPMALGFLFCVAMVWCMARRLAPGAQNAAALVYATSLLPFGAAQYLSTDFLLAAAQSGAMAAWLASRLGDPAQSRRWARWMWLGFGLAFLIKGPPGLLPLLAVAACGLLLRDKERASLWHWSGLVVFAAVALPWFALVVSRTPGLLDYFLGRELVDRLAAADVDRNGEWYGWALVYGPTLVLGSLPWTVWLWRWLRSLPQSLRDWRRRESRDADAVGLMLVLWVILPLLVFCVSRSRMPLYLLGLFTPLALIVARQRAAAGLGFPRVALLGVWVVLLLSLRLASAYVPSHKNAELWADAIRARAPATNTVVFVEDMARYGVHLHLGADVVKLALERPQDRPAFRSFDPEFDTDLATFLARGDIVSSVFVCKARDWSRIEKAFKARGLALDVLGADFEERRLFRARSTVVRIH